MSPEQEERAFESVLRSEAARPGSLLQPLQHGELQAERLMQMAGRHYRRAIRSVPAALADDDPDEVYAHVYEAVRSGAGALPHAYGYRVRGGDGSHLRTLELGAMGLVAWHPEVARELGSIFELVVRQRNQIMYDRPGIITVRDLRQFFESASRVLPAFQAAVERRTAHGSLIAANAWAAPPVTGPAGPSGPARHP